MPFTIVRPTPPSGEIASWALESLDDVAVVRAGLRALLAPDVDDATTNAVVLAASELATNAVRHGGPPARLRLLRGADGYVVDAVDAATGVTPHISTGRAPGFGGFGLPLVVRLAVDVGTYVGDGTKHVWARFGTAGASTSPAGSRRRIDT